MLFKVKDYASLQTALDGLCRFLTEREIGQEQVFDCKLVACELLGNVLKYTDGDTGLYAEIADGFVRLKVTSNTFFELPENIVCSGLYAESGRGLFIVNTLCEGQIVAEKDGIVAKIKMK